MNNILGIVMAIMCVLTLVILPITIFILGKKSKINQVRSEFNDFYEELLFYYSEEMKKIRKIDIIVTTVIILSMIILVALVTTLAAEMDVTNLSIVAAIVLIGGTIYIANNNKFAKKYKKEIIERLAKEINPSLEYRAKEKDYLGVQYLTAKFGDEKFLNFWDDCMMGYLDNAMFSFGELETSKVKTSGGRISGRSILFQGIFANLNYTSNVKGRIVISNFLDKYIKKQNEYKIEIGNDDFENRFNVYSTDEFEARNLIGINFIDDFLRVCDEYGVSPDVVIESNNIFFRFNMGDGLSTGTLFEPGKNPMDKKQLSRYYNIIKFTNDLMTVLKNAVDAIN